MGYTEFNTAGLTDFDDDDYDIYGAADYMKNPNNFRDFDEGLKEFMYKKVMTKILTIRNYLISYTKILSQ